MPSSGGSETPLSPLRRLVKSKSVQNFRDRLGRQNNVPDTDTHPIPRLTTSAIGAPNFMATTSKSAAKIMGVAPSKDAMTTASQGQKVGVSANTGSASGPSPSHIKEESSKTEAPATPNTPQIEVTRNMREPRPGPSSSQRAAAADTAENTPTYNPYYPHEDPYAKVRQAPVQYGPIGPATALSSNPARPDDIDFEHTASMSVQEKGNMGAIQAEKEVQRGTFADMRSGEGKKEAKKVGFAALPEERKEAPKGSPLKRYSKALGSKVKGVFNKKEKTESHSAGRSGSQEGGSGRAAGRTGSPIQEE
jgi:hypothetical protein